MSKNTYELFREYCSAQLSYHLSSLDGKYVYDYVATGNAASPNYTVTVKMTSPPIKPVDYLAITRSIAGGF